MRRPELGDSRARTKYPDRKLRGKKIMVMSVSRRLTNVVDQVTAAYSRRLLYLHNLVHLIRHHLECMRQLQDVSVMKATETYVAGVVDQVVTHAGEHVQTVQYIFQVIIDVRLHRLQLIKIGSHELRRGAYQVYSRLVAHKTCRANCGILSKVLFQRDSGSAVGIIPPEAIHKGFDWLKRAFMQNQVFLEHVY